MAADLQLERVSYAYPGGGRALADLHFGIEAGSYTVVFGRNGSGKSTFAHLPNGLIPHVVGGALTGRVTVRGRDTRDHRPASLFELAGLVFQNPEAQLFSSTVSDELAFGLENMGLAPEAVAGRIRETSERLGIVELLDRPPEALSGGEQRLAAIASVLAMDPPVVLLDEPFAGLDWRYAPRVAAILAELNRTGSTVVVIEHRAGNYLRDAARLLVFDGGRVVLDAPCGLDAEPALKVNRLLPEYPPLPPAGGAGDEVLAVDALCASVGGRPVLNDVGFALRAGEVAALVGENGAGKSTLVRHLIGLAAPSAGTVRLRGRSIGGRPPAELAREVGICFQNPDDQFFTTSVRAEIEVGLRHGRPHGLGLEGLSRIFELDAVLDRPPHLLSAGEKKRAAIASVLALNPRVLVLDEPTAGQDAAGREALATALRRLSAGGLAVLLVTHDLEFASACARRWIRLHGGRVASDGPPRESRLPLPALGASGGRTVP